MPRLGPWSLFVGGSLLLPGCGARTELEIFVSCGNGLLDEGEQCDDGNRIDHDGCDNACRPRNCGDAEPDAGEECDLGADNEDRPAILLIHASRRQAVMPIDRPHSAVAFYDYVSESSHTGLERVDHSALFLFRDTRNGSLSLFAHHGIDEDSSGVTLDHGLVDMDFEGLPDGVAVLLADEETELYLTDPGRASGRWEFWRNTDGGVLGALPFPGNWEIHVTIALHEGIRTWSYYDAGQEEIQLSSSEEAILRTFDTPSRCRTDCTVPRCGDGIVDGGEVCDDGNTVAGDGCSADCTAL